MPVVSRSRRNPLAVKRATRHRVVPGPVPWRSVSKCAIRNKGDFVRLVRQVLYRLDSPARFGFSSFIQLYISQALNSVVRFLSLGKHKIRKSIVRRKDLSTRQPKPGEVSDQMSQPESEPIKFPESRLVTLDGPSIRSGRPAGSRPDRIFWKFLECRS